jgi:hypothetical protein
VLSDTVTKIFSIAEPGRSLAYAFGGTVALTDKDDHNIILFDFRDEATRALKSLSKTWYDHLSTYATKLAKRLQNRLEKARENEKLEPLKKNDPLVAALFLAGYYAKTPSAVVVQFRHEEQLLLPPSVRVVKLEKGYAPLVTYASAVISQQLFLTENPAFSPYRSPRINAPDAVTLSEVADAGTRYILACADPEAMKIDAEHCAGIGGHVHMAKVTAQNGFQWVIPPKTGPVTPSATGAH